MLKGDGATDRGIATENCNYGGEEKALVEMREAESGERRAERWIGRVTRREGNRIKAVIGHVEVGGMPVMAIKVLKLHGLTFTW